MFDSIEAAPSHSVPAGANGRSRRLTRITSRSDVARLRRELADRTLGETEMALLFTLERENGRKPVEWTDFFVDTVTDYLVWHSRPTGVVSLAQAEWLIREVDATATLNAFAILVNVLAEADRVPAWFTLAVRARAARGWPGVEEAAIRPGAIAQLDAGSALT